MMTLACSSINQQGLLALVEKPLAPAQTIGVRSWARHVENTAPTVALLPYWQPERLAHPDCEAVGCKACSPFGGGLSFASGVGCQGMTALRAVAP